MYVFEHVTTQQQLFADCHLMQIRHLACTEFNSVTTETLSSHSNKLNCTLYSQLLYTNRFVKVFRDKWPTSVRTASFCCEIECVFPNLRCCLKLRNRNHVH